MKSKRKLLLTVFLITLAAMFMLTGCEDIREKDVNSSTERSAAESEEKQTEPTLPQRDRTIDTDSEFVIDDEKTLSDGEYDSVNEYAAWLSRTYKINACVKITSDIGEKSPQEYADELYNKLYGSTDGIMLLVNNDTGNDVFLRKGVPGLFISDSDVEMLWADISPLLVTEKYSEAIQKALETAELSLPEFAIDCTGSMTAEEITAANDILKGSEENLSVVYLSSTGDKKIAEYAKEKSKKYFAEGESSAILFVNVKTGEYAVCSQGKLSGLKDDQKEIKESISGCITKTDGKKTFSYTNAAEIFVNFSVK